MLLCYSGKVNQKLNLLIDKKFLIQIIFKIKLREMKMKNLKFALLVLITFTMSGIVFSQGMNPPAPIKSATLDAMTGNWVSETYEMMGMKFTDEVTISMILNGQFLQLDIKSNSDAGFNFEGKGIMVPSADGTITGWVFDNYGKDDITTYTGEYGNGKMTMIGKNAMMKENREITVDGNIMTQNVTYIMNDGKGNDMPPMAIKIVSKKK